ncbi:MAG: DUF6779 domain-containing protein [Pseudonocardiaceae bacterium]
MTGPKPRIRYETGRVLILSSVVLAVLAAAALALGTDDVRLLRLGIVAALWATLLGTFAAVRIRREASSSADRADELRVVYQLELDREIAARREHELRVERELREQVELREQREITALRAELAALRDTLRNLLGGDVLVERVALRAESTRLRPISDRSRPGVDGPGRIPAAQTAPRSSPSLLSAEPVARGARPNGRDSWETGRSDLPNIPHVPDAPDIYAQTAAELNGDTANHRWSPAVSPVPSWRSALDQGPPEGPPTQEVPSSVNRQVPQGGRHSRPSVPRYGNSPSSAREANGNGSPDRRPVNELLASYGDGIAPRRRHGRRDD